MIYSIIQKRNAHEWWLSIDEGWSARLRIRARRSDAKRGL